MSSLWYFLLVIVLVVGLHEGGHFLAGKLLGFRILRFSIGIGPVIAKFQRGETEYCLSALPLGGYVQFFDKNHPDYESAPASLKALSFEAQPKLKQAVVLAAGVAVNFLTCIVIFAVMQLQPNQAWAPMLGQPAAGSQLASVANVAGSTVVKLNGEPVESLLDVMRFEQLHPGQSVTLTLRKDHEEREITLNRDNNSPPLGVEPFSTHLIIGQVLDKSPAQAAGLKVGDTIKTIAGHPVKQLADLAFFDTWKREHPNEAVTLEVERDGTPLTLNVPLHDGKIGVGFVPMGPTVTVQRNVLEATKDAVWMFARLSSMQLEGLVKLITHPGSEQSELAGPIRIAQMAGQAGQAGAQPFFMFVALISVAIGWMNLIPIPALDGGRLLILGVEAVIGRALPDRFKWVLMAGSMVVILSLMLWAVGMDVRALWWPAG